MKRVLIICTGNSCRSQMAEGWLRSFGKDVEVHSAGTDPADHVNERAVIVMKESGIDIGGQQPQSTDLFLDQPFDYVITVCDDARESCPVFSGAVGRQLHIGFGDPSHATGTEEEIMREFRAARDLIRDRFRRLYDLELGGGT